MKRFIYLFIYIIALSHQNLMPDLLGSDTSVQLVNNFTFPATPKNQNRVAKLAVVESGFSLQSNLTTCTFDSVFPVAGPISLNGGKLVLNRDLIFKNSTTVPTWGRVDGFGYRLNLSQNITSLPTSSYMFIDTVLSLQNDLTINSTITFKNSTINGNGYNLILGANANIQVANGSVLTLKNLTLQGVDGMNVACLSDFSSLVLDDVTWLQSNSFTFTIGSLSFKDHVKLGGAGRFTYQTLKVSTVNANSMLELDHGFTFSYDPIRLNSKDLLNFVDASSKLLLNGATLHATNTGLNLKKGTLFVQGSSVLESEIQGNHDQGITLGDGSNTANDFAVDVTTGAQLLLNTGSLNYKNLNSSSWLMENSISALSLAENTTVRLYKSLNLGNGVLKGANGSTVARVPTAQLLGSTIATGNIVFVQI